MDIQSCRPPRAHPRNPELRPGPTLRRPAGRRQPAGEAEPQPGSRRQILCACCRHPITAADQITSVNDRHCHTFPNPLGIVFSIRCFREAPGCLPHGAPTPEFSWFSGYRWQHALCANCLTHLGWRFLNAAGDSFFGLEEGKLIEGESNER